jgi:hypothetical protein
VPALVYFLTVCRGALLQDLADAYFPHLRKSLLRSKRFDIWLQPLIGLAHGILVVSSAVGRRVLWREIGYRLSSDGKVQSIWRGGDPVTLPMPGR